MGSEAIHLDLISHFTHGYSLYPAQQQAVDLLEAGKSVCAIMATGRGKSAIFQIHAAKLASQGLCSVLVYPLRALIADQYFSIQQTFSKLGYKVALLSGQTSMEGRPGLYEQLTSGQLNVVLTTPEFLQLHLDLFVKAGNIKFVVLDEAHHIAQDGGAAGSRPTYGQLADLLSRLNSPQVFAASATASELEINAIVQDLNIDSVVVDQTGRDNLHIVDQRNIADRDAYLLNLVSQNLRHGKKTLVNVSSRTATIQLCKWLRKNCRDYALEINFYNAALEPADRKAVEYSFAKIGAQRVDVDGADFTTTCLIATSAFGEGVNIPDIRHSVIYNLPYDAIALNQSSGRAGRDGNDAYVHLLFNQSDAEANWQTLSSAEQFGQTEQLRYINYVNNLFTSSTEQVARQITYPIIPQQFPAECTVYSL